MIALGYVMESRIIKRGRCEMKVIGTKCYVQIEDDAGNIARFDGEVCFREFCALADSIQ